jgi:hypothetical protein
MTDGTLIDNYANDLLNAPEDGDEETAAQSMNGV